MNAAAARGGHAPGGETRRDFLYLSAAAFGAVAAGAAKSGRAAVCVR